MTTLGERLSRAWVTERVRRYVDKSRIGKKGSCHSFRHTMATLMLEGGADVRFVQEMLGHTKLETTQVYTQVSIQKLKEMLCGDQPGAKLRTKRSERWNKHDDASSDAKAHADTQATEELFFLAAEAADEDADG